MTPNARNQPGSDPQDGWVSTARFALLLAGLVFVAFPGVLLGSETFVLRDYGLFGYPLAFFQRQCFQHGELPFWNPYINCGVPFLAQWNTMPLYPPALLYLVLPLTWALGFFCLAHLWFGGLGMFLLARRWTGNSLAAALAGILFVFNGLSLNLLMWPSHIATLSWMPWVVLAGEAAREQGGRKLLAAAAAGAGQMLAGGPETIFLTWVLVCAFWTLAAVGRSAERSNAGGATSWRLVATRLAALVLLVIGLTAVQMFPFLDLVGHSERQQGFADTSWSMPGYGWANFLVPMVFGSTWGTDVFYQYGQYWTSSYYVGLAAILLAGLALVGGRERRAGLLAGAAGLAFVCALGDHTPIYPVLRRLLPFLTLMTYPVKFVTVIAFAAPLLAGFGLARLRGAGPLRGGMPWEKRVLWGAGLLLVLVGIVLVWAGSAPHPRDDFPATLRNGIGRAALLVVVVALLVCLGRMVVPRAQVLLAGALLVVVWLDLLTHEPSQNPTVSPSVYAPGIVRAEQAMDPQPALGESRVMLSPAADQAFNQLRPPDLRAGYLAKRLGYFSNCNLLEEVPKVNGFASLSPRCFAVFSGLLYSSTNREFPAVEDFLGVSQLTAPGEFTRFAPRHGFLPFVTAGQRPLLLEDMVGLRQLFAPYFDGRKVVLLPPDAAAQIPSTNAAVARVLSCRVTLSRVEADLEAAAPTLAVVAQAYYHCWRAYVDDQPAPLLRANYAFQAVPVPAGRHRVRLAYEDPAFRLGGVVSLLTLLGGAVAWVYWGRPRQAGAPARP